MVRSQRGIVLVVTLMVVVMVVMTLTAAVKLIPGSAAMQGNAEQQELADAAVQAGLAYARSRLQEDPNWRGDADMVVVDMPGEMWVSEESGNVIGILYTANGVPTQFRIRFNYQNGGGSPDEGFSDPPSDHFIDNRYVSVNNLTSNASVPVYRADDAYEVDGSDNPYDCPRYSAVICVEGRSGPGLRELSPANLDPDSGRVVSRVAEAMLGRDVSQFGDAAVYSGGNTIGRVDPGGGEFYIDSLDAGLPPRMRSMYNVDVNDAELGGDAELSAAMETSGEVVVWDLDNPGTGDFLLNGSSSTTPAATNEDSSGKFLKIPWSDIDRADSGAGDAVLPAGTYVWRNGGSGPELHYYAQEYDGVTIPSGVPDQVFTDGQSPAGDLTAMELETAHPPEGPPPGTDVDDPSFRVLFKKNVEVQSVAGVQGVAFLGDGIQTMGRRPIVELVPPAAPTDPAAIVTAPGSVQIEGELKGTGSVTSEGDIRFQGSSVLEADPDMKVAIYAKGDVTLELMDEVFLDDIDLGGGGGGKYAPPPPPDWNVVFGDPKYEDMAFAGVVYAQGNFTANLRSTERDSDLYIQGVLVAYGGDPETDDPGGPTPSINNGQVFIDADNVQLIYDSSYVANLKDQSAGGQLDIVSFNTY